MSAVGCVMRARWFVGGRDCWLPVWARGGRLRALGGRGGYWRVVGEGVFLPPLFCCCRCSPGLGEAKGGGVGRVFSFFFLCEGCGFWWL